MTNEEYWFWLCNIRDIYQPDIKRLLEHFSSPEEIYLADEEKLRQCGCLNDKDLHHIALSKKSGRFMEVLGKLKRENIEFIYPGHPEFPDCLDILPDKPFCLYVKGKLPDCRVPSAGMVGSRACSAYGRDYAGQIAAVLAGEGVQIISGMAIGIDSISAQSAINSGGKTFAVLGGGVDVIYPRENIELYYEIITSGGGIISEYPLGTAPLGWQFPHRNRLITAFSDVLVVIEAGKHSGTLTTAMHALNQGKDIYALPGRVSDRLSEGCNGLIADGAGMITSPSSVLDALKCTSKWQRFSRSADTSGETNALNAAPSVSATENTRKRTARMEQNIADSSSINSVQNNVKQDVLRLASGKYLTIDEMVQTLGLSISDANQVICEMELEGLISRLPSGQFIRKF